MANKRIYYAIQQVKLGTGASKTAVHGLQSAGITTNFNLEQVFELGQLEIYQNVENIPEIEVTLNKVLDGYPTLYVLATETGTEVDTSAIATGTDLAGRQNARVDLELGIFNDNKPSVQGNSISAVKCKGMYVSSISYTFPVDGNFTEDVTLVGNDKIWANITATADADLAGNNDSPLDDRGVNRRQHLDMTRCLFPKQIPGINQSTGLNEKQTGASGVGYNVHFQNVTVSCDLGRETIFELGSFAPYCRYVTFPVEVTSEFEVIAINGDNINATENGYFTVNNGVYTADPNGVAEGCTTARSNLRNETIELYTCEGTMIKLGEKNKLTSVNYAGGDTGGGNVTVTYSYSTFNSFNVAHEQGPIYSTFS